VIRRRRPEDFPAVLSVVLADERYLRSAVRDDFKS
jgi:hypothetical protein